MRLLLPLIVALPGLAAASVPVRPAADPLASELQRAQAEQAAAEREADRFEQVASKARSEAERLSARQAAAAQAIQATEARISAADARLRLISAYLQTRRDRLQTEQQPIAALLSGLAVMAQRPPLLAIADQGSTDEFMQVRVLLDATLPVIRRRTGALTAEMARGTRLEQAAERSRAELIASRRELGVRRQQFAQLERQAIRDAAAAGGQALSAGDVALVAGDDFERLRSNEAAVRAARADAAALAAAGPALPRPFGPDGERAPVPLEYQMPASAPIVEGLGSVSATGLRSRGLTLASPAGAVVNAPADGVVAFSGAFRDWDGVLIIDHGQGWITLLLNVSSPLKRGERIRIGDPIGRAIGPLGVELSQNGRRISPALIAR